jgi:Arc/MetJ family transcription regulator
MRTTISLDDDVAAAIEQLRRESGKGLSEAVNDLVRAGLAAPRRTKAFRQQTRPLGLRIDVANVGEALELLEGPLAR